MKESDFEDLVTTLRIKPASVPILASSSRLGFWTRIIGDKMRRKR